MLRRTLFVTISLLIFDTTMLMAQQPPGAPAWFPLSVEQDKYLNDVLKYWEYQAGLVKHYRCKFIRWEYDPVVLPRNPEIAASIAQGRIEFAAPDKGLFKVEQLGQVVVQQQGNNAIPVMKDGKPQYSSPPEILGQHWICDGKSIFEFDSINKQLKKRALPPEMQGQQITEGPLPFLFGAKSQTIQDRYWIRVVSPPPKKNHFWLEAVPKRREEAADFKTIHVIIDEKDFLPTALILYEQGEPGGRTTYEFANREKNWTMLPAVFTPWIGQFYAPKPPPGWKLVEEPFQVNPAPAGPVARTPQIGPAPPRKAQGVPIGPMRR